MPKRSLMSGFEKPLPFAPPAGKGADDVAFRSSDGFFLSIGWNRKLQSDSCVEAHPIEARTSIGWKLSCQSDALSPLNPLRFRISIH